MMGNMKTKSIIIILSSLLLLLLSFAATWYWYDFINRGLKNISVVTQEDNNSLQLAKLQSLRRESRDTAENRRKLHSLTIKEVEIPAFLNKLESLKSLKVSTKAISKSLDTGLLTVTLYFSGDFDDVMLSMGQLSKIRRAIYIDSFEVRKSDGEAWDARMRLVILLSGSNK